MDARNQKRFFRIKDIIPSRYPIAESTFWGWVRTGYAPQPIKLGRTTVWDDEELSAFDEKLKESRGAFVNRSVEKMVEGKRRSRGDLIK